MLIQIAGVRDEGEVDLLRALKVPLIGFPLGLDVHAPDLSIARAAVLTRRITPPSRAVLITYLPRAGEIGTLADELGVDCIQIHGAMTVRELRALRRARPGCFLIRSLVVRDDNAGELLRCMDESSPWVNAFITDSFDPVSGASGATGKVHDWAVSRRLVERAVRPVILAGGLDPDNVEAAIDTVRPAGVDVHTGVEDARGAKDPEKVRLFVVRARRGLGRLQAFEGAFENDAGV